MAVHIEYTITYRNIATQHQKTREWEAPSVEKAFVHIAEVWAHRERCKWWVPETFNVLGGAPRGYDDIPF